MKAPPEVPDVIPKEDREWTLVPCVNDTSERSLKMSTRMVKIFRRARKLRASDGAIPWKILMLGFRGYDETVNGTFGVWKRRLEMRRTRYDLNIVSTKTVNSST